MRFQLDIVSLKGSVFTGEAEEVIIPSLSGEMSVLARHMPLVTPLTTGVVVVKTSQTNLYFSIGKGVFSIANDAAMLLIEDVESADEISEEKANEAKRKAEEIIAKGVEGEEKLKAHYLLRKSLVDLKIVRRKRKLV